MKRACLILYLALVLFSTSAFSQQKTIDLNSYKEKNRPFLFYFHTDWCVYCAMQERLLKNKDISRRLAENYDFIDFNAESGEDIIWKNLLFKNNTPQKYTPHPFVLQFFPTQAVGYPSWIITDKDLNVKLIYPGYIKKKELIKLLDFYK